MKEKFCKQLELQFQKTVKQYALIGSQERILVGVSGGSDSTALLYLLCSMIEITRLVVVYVDHGLRPKEVVQEKAYLQSLCQRLGIPCYFEVVAVKRQARKEKQSLEEAGRVLRYQCFQKIAAREKCQKIAVGHTADDQVENFFLRLFRGTGVRGIRGMHYSSGNLIRPILGFHKRQLQEYLSAKDISWVEDSSNTDSRFLRNRIRRELLPFLTKRFTTAVNKKILQFMAIAAEEDSFLDNEAEKIWPTLVEEEQDPFALVIAIDSLLREHIALQRRVIERCCWQMRAEARFDQIRKILSSAAEKKNRELHLADGLRVEVTKKTLRFHRPLRQGQKRGSGRPAVRSFSFSVPATGVYNIPQNRKKIEIQFVIENTKNLRNVFNKNSLAITFDTLSFPLTIRTPVAGDIFVPCNREGSKKISRFLAEKKIAPAQRLCWPLIIKDKEIIAVAGMEIADRYKVTSATKTVLVISYTTVTL